MPRPSGTPKMGVVIERPLRAPVVVTITTGRPETHEAAVERPPVQR